MAKSFGKRVVDRRQRRDDDGADAKPYTGPDRRKATPEQQEEFLANVGNLFEELREEDRRETLAAIEEAKNPRADVPDRFKTANPEVFNGADPLVHDE